MYRQLRGANSRHSNAMRSTMVTDGTSYNAKSLNYVMA